MGALSEAGNDFVLLLLLLLSSFVIVCNLICMIEPNTACSNFMSSDREHL